MNNSHEWLPEFLIKKISHANKGEKLFIKFHYEVKDLGNFIVKSVNTWTDLNQLNKLHSKLVQNNPK